MSTRKIDKLRFPNGSPRPFCSLHRVLIPNGIRECVVCRAEQWDRVVALRERQAELA